MNGLIAATVEQRRLPKLAFSAGDRIAASRTSTGLGGRSRETLRRYQLGGESASRERSG
jgi:hypothetical protein